MSVFLRKNWVIFAVLSIFLLIISFTLILSLKNTNNQLIYAGDDAYIHMAMAKNFSKYGVWGITKYSFSSSSSSLSWTLLLSFLYKIIGVNEIMPFILNVIFSVLILLLSYRILQSFNIYGIYNFLILLALLFFSPLPAVVFTGMEHSAHIFISLFFIYLAVKIMTEENLKKEKRWLLILSFFIITVRYESIFLVFIICVLFLIRKKIRLSLTIGFLAILPILIYGCISVFHGWYFFPNSILLKGYVIDFSSVKTFVKSVFYFKNINIIEIMNPLFALTVVSLLLFTYDFLKYRIFWKKQLLLNFIFVIIALFHIKFARFGGFYRYEAYLIAIGVMAISIISRHYLAEKVFNTPVSKFYRIAVIILSFLMGYQMISRGFSSLIEIPRACANIYQQQYQMGLFLKSFYQGKEVAANDVGAINYLSEIKNLDLWGLGTIEVAKLKRANKYNRNTIYDLAKRYHVKIAIVYDNWFWNERIGGLPSTWAKVGEWEISDNVVCGGEVVSFYAVEPGEKNILLNNLRRFSKKLPKEVDIRYYNE